MRPLESDPLGADDYDPEGMRTMNNARKWTGSRVSILVLVVALMLYLFFPAVRASAVPGESCGSGLLQSSIFTTGIRMPRLHRIFPFERPDVVFFLYLMGRLFSLALYGALIVLVILLLRSSRGHERTPPPMGSEPADGDRDDQIARLESEIDQLKKQLEQLQGQDDEHTDHL